MRSAGDVSRSPLASEDENMQSDAQQHRQCT